MEIHQRFQGEQFNGLMEKYNIKDALLFGSYGTDEFSDYSDIDIAVISDDSLPLDTLIDLELKLEPMLGRKVDIVDLNSINLDMGIKAEILNRYEIIYSTDDNKAVEILLDRVSWWFRENENFLYFRERDLLS